MLFNTIIINMILQIPSVPMTTHDVILMGIDIYSISFNVPMRPMKMRFIKITSAPVRQKVGSHESYAFTIYLISMGLMGIMGLYNIISSLQFPLKNPSWELMG